MDKIKLLEDYKKHISIPRNIPDHHRPFYIIWVEKFLMNLEENHIHKKLKYEDVQKFISVLLLDPRYEEWQIKQAVDAVNIFIGMLRDKSE